MTAVNEWKRKAAGVGGVRQDLTEEVDESTELEQRSEKVVEEKPKIEEEEEVYVKQKITIDDVAPVSIVTKFQ